jgi:hypothetical protein
LKFGEHKEKPAERWLALRVFVKDFSYPKVSHSRATALHMERMGSLILERKNFLSLHSRNFSAPSRPASMPSLRSISESLCDLHRKFDAFTKKTNQRHIRIMNELDQLKAEVAATRTVEESAIALLKGLKAKLDAAIASGDPKALTELSDSLGSERAALASAVTENTPAE